MNCVALFLERAQWPWDLLPGADGCWGWECVLRGLDSTARQQGRLPYCHGTPSVTLPSSLGLSGASLQHQEGLLTNLERNAWSLTPDLPDSRPSEKFTVSKPHQHTHRWKLRMVTSSQGFVSLQYLASGGASSLESYLTGLGKEKGPCTSHTHAQNP